MDVDTLWEALTAENITCNTIFMLRDMYPELLNNKLKTGHTLLTNIISYKKHLTNDFVIMSKIDVNAIGNGFTPLVLAIKLNEPDIAMLLLRYNAIVTLDAYHFIQNITNLDHRIKVKEILDSKFIAEPKKEKHITANQLVDLVQSCETNTGLLTIILQSCRNIWNDRIFHKNTSNSASQNTNIMFWAAQNSPSACKVLIELGANINCLSNIRDTPLIAAAQANQFDCMKQLMLAGAKVYLRNNKGQAAMEHIMASSHKGEKRDHALQLLKTKIEESREKVPADLELKRNNFNKFANKAKINYKFCAWEITTGVFIEIVTMAIKNNIPFKVSGGEIIMNLQD